VKSKKEFRFLISLLVTILLAQNAGAAQSVVVAYNSPGATFDVVGASATVDKDASKLFRDTGQISNRTSAAGLSLSPEQIWEGVSAWSPGINNDPMHHYVDPVWWTPVIYRMACADTINLLNILEKGRKMTGRTNLALVEDA
jgi:hypothetical protein